MLLPLIAVALRPRPAAVRLQRAPCVTGCDGSPWTEEETWALVDSTPAFTAGKGKNAATFWTALVASNAVLCQRSPSECMEHAAQLAAVQNATQPFGPEPAILENWSRQPDGRISGTLRGRAVWLNVDLEARLEADPRPTASYVETVGGIVYELGRRLPSDDPTSDAGGAGAGAGDADADALRRWGVLQGAAAAPAAGTGTVLLSLLAAGVVGFFGGAEFGSYEYIELQPAQPPPAPLPARAAQPAQQLPAARTYPAAERVSLTVSEQAARQQIRLDSAPPPAQKWLAPAVPSTPPQTLPPPPVPTTRPLGAVAPMCPLRAHRTSCGSTTCAHRHSGWRTPPSTTGGSSSSSSACRRTRTGWATLTSASRSTSRGSAHGSRSRSCACASTERIWPSCSASRPSEAAMRRRCRWACSPRVVNERQKEVAWTK